MATWLFKSEPETYSFDTLLSEKKTAWNGVRNFQARNFLRECKKGELALIYHSGKSKSVVGVAKILGAPYAEVDKKKAGDWVQVDIGYHLAFKTPVPLSVLKSNAALKNLLLIKQSRLSCMPVTDSEFKTIVQLGGAWADLQKS
jgi:predicted RNA-binding protein with PUA-like domain